MQYQSFPEIKGDSCSVEKLKALRLPSLQGKSFLDVGCNEGYFCGYASFEGASKAVGIDRSAEAIRRAKARFPGCDFVQQSWDTLPDGKFDVILLASALHYADDQAALIRRLVEALTPAGTLVLEIGLVESSRNEWTKVKRSIDERSFPSRAKLKEILNPFAWKIVGRSVQQAGDPVGRVVVHVGHLKPFAALLLGEPGSGKTTFCRRIFDGSSVPVVMGDLVYSQIRSGKTSASLPLFTVVQEGFESTRLSELTEKVFEQDLGGDLFDVWCNEAGFRDCVIESYLPLKYHNSLQNHLVDRGYLPVMVNCSTEITMAPLHQAEGRAKAYTDYLRKEFSERPGNIVHVIKLPKRRERADCLRWHLDSPRHTQPCSGDSDLAIAGWVWPKNLDRLADVRCYVKSSFGVNFYNLNMRRPDVVKTLSEKQDSLPADAICCGFNFTISGTTLAKGVEVGFLFQETEIPAVKIGVGEGLGSNQKKTWKKKLRFLGRLIRA